MTMLHRVFLFYILFVLAGCSSLDNKWSNDAYYDDRILNESSKNDITWEIVNNYVIDSEYFYDHIQSVDSLNSVMVANTPKDYSIKKLAYESTRLHQSPLRVRDVPEFSSWHYEDGLGRYGEMIDLVYDQSNIEYQNLGISQTPQEVNNILVYKPLLPVKNWIVKLSIDTEQEICDWTLGNSDKKHKYKCSEFYVFVTENGLNISTTLGVEKREITVKPTNYVILVLGDSYISGEGNGPWMDTKCHRSFFAWPNLLAARYASEYPHRSVTLISRACSGARVEHVHTMKVTTKFPG